MCFALMSGIFFLLHWLMQPVKVANLGLAAYSAPPNTHLEPLPRKMDAPELTDLAPLSAHALAQAPISAAETEPKQEVRPRAPKRQKAKARREPQPWGYAYGGWNPGRGYDRQWQGGYRTW
jgi:hypothetical protein